jgi:hypothetical protein
LYLGERDNVQHKVELAVSAEVAGGETRGMFETSLCEKIARGPVGHLRTEVVAHEPVVTVDRVPGHGARLPARIASAAR